MYRAVLMAPSATLDTQWCGKKPFGRLAVGSIVNQYYVGYYSIYTAAAGCIKALSIPVKSDLLLVLSAPTTTIFLCIAPRFFIQTAELINRKGKQKRRRIIRKQNNHSSSYILRMAYKLRLTLLAAR